MMMTMIGGNRVASLVLGLLLLLPVMLQAQVRHDLQVVLQPVSHQLHVTDTITLPVTDQRTWTFRLHVGLNPFISDPDIRLAPQLNEAGDTLPKTASYTLTLPPGRHRFTLHYQGTLFHPVPASGAAYARGFQTTPGLIAAEGTYLSASTAWYPQFAEHLLTFALQVQLPAAWDAVSQGQRTQYDRQPGHTRVTWEEAHPQEEIYLIAAPFTAYEQMTGQVRVMAFLRTPDPALATQYLDTTGQYLAMYEALIGPYPYRKFALVENFWQTGYGMPSFTLLGSKVLRLPFILHSSYPHEILHNWWGNSVYIDATDGNWAEGLTAYLADHLIKEQRGIAVNYRRDELQKYAHYVTSGQDLPIAAFQTRHDPVTQAVGYGKTMMLFHMLRQQIGNDTFIQALQTFFRTYRFRHARFTDLLQIFADADINVQSFYQQWIARPGAPEIRVRDAQVQRDREGYRLKARIEQVQSGSPYTLQLPIAVTLDGLDHAHTTTVEMRDARFTLDLRLPARPQRLDIDAQFDLFRRLHRDEIPPALSQMFGATNVLMLLPASAPEAVRQGYRRLAQAWQQPGLAPFDIRLDTDISAWPTDRSVWLFGWDNRWHSQVATALTPYPATLQPDQVQVDGTILSRLRHSVMLTVRNPANPAHALGWIATDHAAALPELGRKLPHYGKYSYLGFTGDEATNIAKGQWPVGRSPMSVILPSPAGAPYTDESEGRVLVPRAKLPAASALASLPPLFSAERMQQTIQYLASDGMRGRGFGTPELDQAADFLVSQFRAAGLQPGGDEPKSYVQAWPARGGEPTRNVTLKNIVGIIPGQRSAWDGQSVVVGAHYDHLGRGWPDVHQGDRGQVHPGADDNASGVAVLLELARVLGKGWQPDRTIVFVAFSGEEAGRLGSQHYVAHTTRWPVAQSISMMNVDTVGRLGQNRLQVLGTASAREWPHIFRGAEFVTGVPVQPIAQGWGASDQRSFLDAGIPAVQLSSGPHLDYHRPTDTIDHIDFAGLVKVAAVAREALVYLAGRDEPLSSALRSPSDSQATPSQKTAPSRRVSLGTVPDFAYDGRGYRIGDVVPDSPAVRAGLQAGDVIIQVDTTPIADIRAFANALRTLHPGATVALTIRRGDAEQTLQAQLTAR